MARPNAPSSPTVKKFLSWAKEIHCSVDSASYESAMAALNSRSWVPEGVTPLRWTSKPPPANEHAMRNGKTKMTRGSQSGFALMMVMFLATVLLISVMVATPYIRTERQREKEE